MHAAFHPFAPLAEALLPHAVAPGDGAHDLSHLLRVFRNAMAIQAVEGGDAAIIAAACLLHDGVSLPKDHPDRATASAQAAARARPLLIGLGWEAETVEQVAHAIEAHSFSANLPPRTLEAKIVQDADRLDAIGLIGVARCFYTGGRMGSALYAPADPEGAERPLDDKAYCLDHFPLKLFRLAGSFNTAHGRRLAQARDAAQRRFVTDLLEEIGEKPSKRHEQP